MYPWHLNERFVLLLGGNLALGFVYGARSVINQAWTVQWPLQQKVSYITAIMSFILINTAVGPRPFSSLLHSLPKQAVGHNPMDIHKLHALHRFLPHKSSKSLWTLHVVRQAVRVQLPSLKAMGILVRNYRRSGLPELLHDPDLVHFGNNVRSGCISGPLTFLAPLVEEADILSFSPPTFSLTSLNL